MERLLILSGFIIVAWTAEFTKPEKRGTNEYGYHGITHGSGSHEGKISGGLHYPAKTITLTKKVPVPYEVTVEKKVPYEVKVPVDKPYNVYVPKPYPVYVEKKIPFEVKVPVPQPFTVEKKIPYPVKVPVDKPYPVYVPKPYEVIVEKKVPFTVEEKVPYTVKVPVEKPYPVHIKVEKKVPYPVEKPVPYPVKVAVEKPIPFQVDKPVPYPVEKPVPYTVEKIVHFPVKVPVKVPVKIPFLVQVHKDGPHHQAYSAIGAGSIKNEQYLGKEGLPKPELRPGRNRSPHQNSHVFLGNGRHSPFYKDSHQSERDQDQYSFPMESNRGSYSSQTYWPLFNPQREAEENPTGFKGSHHQSSTNTRSLAKQKNYRDYKKELHRYKDGLSSHAVPYSQQSFQYTSFEGSPLKSGNKQISYLKESEEIYHDGLDNSDGQQNNGNHYQLYDQNHNREVNSDNYQNQSTFEFNEGYGNYHSLTENSGQKYPEWSEPSILTHNSHAQSHDLNKNLPHSQISFTTLSPEDYNNHEGDSSRFFGQEQQNGSRNNSHYSIENPEHTEFGGLFEHQSFDNSSTSEENETPQKVYQRSNSFQEGNLALKHNSQVKSPKQTSYHTGSSYIESKTYNSKGQETGYSTKVLHG